MKKTSIAKVALLAAVCFPAVAFAGAQDIVRDRDSDKVYSSYGDCVRTKWEAGKDYCISNGKPHSMNDIRKSVGQVSRSYLSFFDFDSSVLSSDAKRIIKASFDAGGANAQYDVTGHADRAGSDAYNNALSKRRAVAVKRELMSLGVRSGNIIVRAKGESEPLVPTADGVREPQNRRVEIVYMVR